MKIRKFAMMLSLSAVLGLIACGSDDSNPASDGGVSGSTMVDSRDGQSYRIVKIGKQTWMAQNLNYAAPNSVCYDNNPDFCAMYGRLYFYDAVPGACPSGWHAPSGKEWRELLQLVADTLTYGLYQGMEKLISKEGWGVFENSYVTNDCNGSDDYGFTVLPAGQATLAGGFMNAGTSTEFWAYEFKERIAYDWPDGDYYRVGFGKDTTCPTTRTAFVSSEGVIGGDLYNTEAKSIRCVKD